MSRDDNFFFGKGKVLHFKEGETSQGDLCASFVLAMDEGTSAAWVRCNAYGPVAKYCIDNLKKEADCFVLIRGRIMNRRDRKGLAFTEIRCKDVSLVNND